MEAASASEARRFGKYTLVAKLATGGMAEIFLARLHGDGGFEKLVCIKRILPHLAKDPQFVAMFLDEARVAARISHPNVCQVFELGEWHGQYYIAMEYLEGVPLSVFRRKDFYPLLPDPRLVAGFGVQACEGLHHAHQLKRADGELLGVVHRDVSPQNLFATTDGIVKVLDFGIAKVQDASIRTSTGMVKGTYAYMAPEQLRNENLDRRADVWAVGVVLWETLAQRQLFKRDTEFLTFEAITKLPIPHICEVRADIPALLGDVLARSLARNPDDRFASARSLGEALAQAVAPLGGAYNTAQVSDEVSRSFEATLAEQRMLLRIAREGGQFDLDQSSPLVGHGSRISQTPVSNIQRRVVEAQAEVAHFVAASQAIESLDADDSMVGRRQRFESEGAFTPAPSRRTSSVQQAQRTSQPYPVAPAEWQRFDDTVPPEPYGRRSSAMPAAPVSRSRLPWIIAMIVIAATAGAAIVLYMELREMKNAEQAAPAAAAATDPIVMMKTDGSNAKAEEPADGTKRDAIKDEPKPDDTKVASKQDEPKDDAKHVDAKNVDAKKDEAKKIDAKKDEAKKVEAKKVDTKKDDKKAEPKLVRAKSDKAKVETKLEPKVESNVEKTKVEPPVEVPKSGPPGFITIDSTPVYAVIYIDGKKYGETPLVNLKLPPGKHAVRAVSPSGSTRHLSISIESGKTAPVRRIEW